MSTIEKEIKKEEVGSGCCGGTTQQEAATKEVEAKKLEAEKEKKAGSGCCGG